MRISIIVFMILSGYHLNAQHSVNADADFAWKDLQNILRIRSDDTNRQISYRNFEYKSLQYLEAGQRFAKQFPNDKRWIQWFQNVNSFLCPKFWTDIKSGAKARAHSPSDYSTSINWAQLNGWEKERLKLRQIIMDDTAVSESVKQEIRKSELETEMSRNANSVYRRSKPEFLARVKAAFINGFSHLKQGDDYAEIYREIDRIFFGRNKYNLNIEDVTKFVKFFADSGHPEIQNWARQKLSLFALQKEPFELKHVSIDGKEIDLAKLRGKVVLVDFWGLGCSVCIERMPAIKQIYDNYKDKGFVVLSVARNANIDKEKILTIHDRIGADWPLLLIGGDSDKSGLIAPNSLADKIWKKYGFSYVPQLLLLDKQGKLAEYNGILFNGDFEPLLKKLLAAKM